MLNNLKFLFSGMVSAGLLIGLFVFTVSAEPNIVASLKFDPKLNGFSFENFGNQDRNWQDDLGTDDLIRLFGVNAVCKTGDSVKNCVVKAAAREWIKQQLEGMDGGHCEGMAVTSLRFSSGLPFKNRILPLAFQTTAASPFKLKLDQSIENYIAYYFVTQTFNEVSEPTTATANKGPVEVVKMLIDSFNAGKDTYSLGFYKFANGRKSGGHAITPFAIEDAGAQFKIYVYDNNYPGETHYVVVDKAGKQTWKYIASTNPNEPPSEYVGNIDTKTLELTATSLRDGRCFDSPFSSDGAKAVGCGMESMAPMKPAAPSTPAKPVAPVTPAKPVAPVTPAKPADKKPVIETDEDGESVEFSLNGDGDMLIIDGSGKKIGYDPKTNKFYNEIPGANADFIVGGLGEDLPNYNLPYEEAGKPYTIIFSGKDIEEESEFDFTYSAPGFTVGFNGIKLDPNETLMATVSPGGEAITFTASADGETPEIYFAFDSEDEDDASYIASIDGASLDGGKTLKGDFDFETGKLFFSDNDGNEDEYDIDLIRINADGTEDVYEENDLDIGKSDNYEMDFGKWDGEGPMCFEDDEEGNGFEDDECVPQDEEDNDADGDSNDDSSLLMQTKTFDVFKTLAIR